MAYDWDYDIVRALETRLKAVPWEIDIDFCVVTGLQVLCKGVCN